jgi:hypothetical protein
MNQYLFAYFKDPAELLLSGITIEAISLVEAVLIFNEKYPDVDILYIHNKKHTLWKNE